MTFALFAQSPLLPKSPLIEQYVQRIVSRPAGARAQARDHALGVCGSGCAGRYGVRLLREAPGEKR
jgi:hypothetical protein